MNNRRGQKFKEELVRSFLQSEKFAFGEIHRKNSEGEEINHRRLLVEMKEIYQRSQRIFEEIELNQLKLEDHFREFYQEQVLPFFKVKLLTKDFYFGLLKGQDETSLKMVYLLLKVDREENYYLKTPTMDFIWEESSAELGSLYKQGQRNIASQIFEFYQ